MTFFCLSMARAEAPRIEKETSSIQAMSTSIFLTNRVAEDVENSALPSLVYRPDSGGMVTQDPTVETEGTSGPLLLDPPPNDDCANAELISGPCPQLVSASIAGATLDCPGVLEWYAVWYEIELPYAANN